MSLQALCIISQLFVNSNWSYSLETLNSGQGRQFFALCDLEKDKDTSSKPLQALSII